MDRRGISIFEETTQSQAAGIQAWSYGSRPSNPAAESARPPLWRRLVRFSVWLLFRLVLRTAFRLRVHGHAAIPRRGAFVLVANHTSHVDAAVLTALLPLIRIHDTHPLAARDYFFRHRLLGALVRLVVNAVPIDRENGVEGATAPVLELLARGHGVICFPEGTRSLTGAIAPFKQGVGRLLAGRPYPGIPVAILGAYEVLPKGAWWPRPRMIEIVVGEPVRYEHKMETQDSCRSIAADLECQVRRLEESRCTKGSALDPKK